MPAGWEPEWYWRWKLGLNDTPIFAPNAIDTKLADIVRRLVCPELVDYCRGLPDDAPALSFSEISCGDILYAKSIQVG